MTGMGRPKQFTFGKELLILAAILLVCWLAKDFWP